jgi:hypothetical protein
MHVTNGIRLGCSLLLPVGIVNCVQTLKGVSPTPLPSTQPKGSSRSSSNGSSNRGSDGSADAAALENADAVAQEAAVIGGWALGASGGASTAGPAGILDHAAAAGGGVGTLFMKESAFNIPYFDGLGECSMC